jgi:outer membrane lipoprotein SlyB
MKITSLFSLIPAVALLSACTTEVGPNGQPRQVMTPTGAAVVQGLSAAAIGAGTGALMRGVNPVAAGAISAGAGSIGSQAINAFIPKSSGSQSGQQQTNQQLFVRSGDSFVPAKISYIQQPDGSYAPSYPRGKQLFRQLQNGSFAPVN